MTWKQVTLLTVIVGASAVMIDVGTMSAMRANIFGRSSSADAKTTVVPPRRSTNQSPKPRPTTGPNSGSTSTGAGTAESSGANSSPSNSGGTGLTTTTSPTPTSTGPSQGVGSTSPITGSTPTSASSAPPASPPSPTYPSFGIDTVGPQVVALNERLAELGYLPVTIQGTTTPSISVNNIMSPPTAAFTWKYSNTPSQLTAVWKPNVYTPITRAAVMAVERANGLSIDGIVGPLVWHAILKPDAISNPNPYTYVLVDKSSAPEMLRLWSDGSWVYQSICNTGIKGYNTTDGTYAVYQRYQSQTMRGTNPNGSTYSDAGVPYVNYFNGSQAIHGFVRASYGFPQSLGCVELPISHAKTLWPLIHYGTLVTIEGHYSDASGSSGSAPTGSLAPNTNSTSGSRSGSSSSGSVTTTVYGVHSNH